MMTTNACIRCRSMRMRQPSAKRCAILDLATIGAEVTSVRRHGIRGADPSPDMRLQAGDVVVLRGVPDALELAEQRLLQK